MRLSWIAVLGPWLAGACPAQELIVCGWDTVSVLNVNGAKEPEVRFLWRAEDSPEIPAELRGSFRTTDECKPLPGGRILVTSSSNGVAILERETGKALFWASVANAHSAEMLPGNKLVVAASVHKEGNRLVVFDAAVPMKELFSTELVSAHGVVWDAQRQRLWAIGGRVLRSYRWEEPKLIQEAEFPLPSEGGHDLYAIDKSPHLGLTTEEKVWLFDRERKKFQPHWEIAWEPHVKSVSIHPRTGQVVIVQAQPPEWWSLELEFLRPPFVLRRNERMYKARWVR